MKNSSLLFILSMSCALHGSEKSSAVSLFQKNYVHETFKCAEHIIIKTPYQPQDSFLNVIAYDQNSRPQAVLYAQACGDICAEKMLLENANGTKRQTLKEIAENIIYLNIHSDSNHPYLAENSECEKLLKTVSNRQNHFVIVFNDNNSDPYKLHILEISQNNGQPLEGNLHVLRPHKEKAFNIVQNSPHLPFLKTIITSKKALHAAVKDHMYKKYHPALAEKELNRLGIKTSFLAKAWRQCSITTASYILLGYIIAVVCYKYSNSIPIFYS